MNNEPATKQAIREQMKISKRSYVRGRIIDVIRKETERLKEEDQISLELIKEALEGFEISQNE